MHSEASHACDADGMRSRWRRTVALAAVAGVALVGVSVAANAETPGTFSGSYIGMNAGVAWGQSSFATNPNCPPPAIDATFCNAPPAAAAVNGTAVAARGTGRLSPSGFTGGVQAGRNWQAGTLVYGAEADFGVLDLGESATANGLFPFPFLGTQYSLAEKMTANWLATLRARMGFAVAPHLLLYATGGLAFSELRFSSAYSDNAVDATFPGGTGYGRRSQIKIGWTAGGGVEWLLDRTWSVRAEYLYVDLGSTHVLIATSNTATFTQTMRVDADLIAHIGRLGLNYRF